MKVLIVLVTMVFSLGAWAGSHGTYVGPCKLISLDHAPKGTTLAVGDVIPTESCQSYKDKFADEYKSCKCESANNPKGNGSVETLCDGPRSDKPEDIKKKSSGKTDEVIGK